MSPVGLLIVKKDPDGLDDSISYMKILLSPLSLSDADTIPIINPMFDSSSTVKL